ncbi:MAG: hypothetical protein JWO80_3223 [Bryobacterales bacterium]|nr:hypothetical protein [Bryobacterales bacterium]
MKQIFCVSIFVCLIGQKAHGANPIQTENANPGTTAWQLSNPALNREIEGYASLTSVPVGGQIRFFVSTSAPTYTLEVFRMGWYGGSGGRQMINAVTLTGVNQTIPSADPTTGLIECNWVNPYVLTIPNSWISGIYLTKLTASGSNKQSYSLFVVREDGRPSTYLYQQSASTFEAYNNWPGPSVGGKSLYSFNSPSGEARKVSFNRPYFIDSNSVYANQVGSMFFLRWEYNMVRWLEMQGYDVTYCDNIAVHENANLITTHKAFLSVGHDEYWSWQMRANVEAARDQGVGLGFFSSNTCYWQIRLESSPINGVADRTIVGYKDHASAEDPMSSTCYVTSRWRENPCKPSEEVLLGVEYIEDGVGCPLTSQCLDVVIADASSWALAGSGLSNGSHLVGLGGYEVDGMLAGNSPAGTAVIGHSPIPVNNADASHYPFMDMTSYTASSGATVFATGTMQWPWGLDDFNAPSERPVVSSAAAQKITQNVLARLASVSSGPPPGGPVADEFNSTTLNTSLWTFTNPAGGTFSLNGTNLLLSMPGGAIHDPTATGTDNAVRMMQAIGNVDFDVIVKFDSIPTAQYSNEGIIVEQDGSNFVRFELYSDGSHTYLYGAAIIAGSQTPQINSQVAAGTSSFWLRVKRTGNSWTESWSTDGSNYTSTVPFTATLTVARIGPFGANWASPASNAPAFTASIDYFRNASSSLVPDLTLTKTHSGNFIQSGTGSYTITVKNVGSASTTGAVTMTDTVPTGLTATALSGTGWTCALTPTVNCTRSDPLAASISYPAITLAVSVASNAPATVTNTATVAGGGETNTANDTASDATTISAAGVPDLTVTKTHTGNFTQGGTGSYTITVNNVGSSATTGTVTMTDTVPTGLTATALSGTGWTCALTPSVNCTRSNTLAGGTSYPAITLTVSVASNAPATVTNTATVAGGGETNTANDTASDPTTISVPGVPDLTVTKSHAGNFTQGGTGSYTITVNNVGSAPTTGTVTMTDTVPTGLTATALSGTGWTCALTPTVNCTRSDALASNASYPVITFGVSVANNAPATVTNTASVAGGGETNTSNDTATDSTTVAVGSSGGPLSDEFNSTTLNTSLWTFTNPAGGSFSLNGTNLLLSMPGGAIHDPTATGTDNAVRMMQAIGNVDFDVIVKFDSIPSAQYSNEGIIVEQDGSNFLRFELYSDGSHTYLYGAAITGGSQTQQINSQVAAGASSFWLRVKRTGNSWTESWSTDGSNYTSAVPFTAALTAARIGPFGANWANPASNAPAFTASIDYFRNAGSTSGTPPVISNVSSSPSQSTATITWITDKQASSRVDYGTSTTYGGVTSNSSLVTSHSLSLSGLSCGTLYNYKVTSADSGGNSASSPNGTFNTVSCGGAGVPQSDNFDSSSLNTSLWTFVNPAGGSYSLSGTHLLLSVPAGSIHDPTATGTDNAVRMMQTIGNVDFDVFVKLDSIPAAQYSNEGILVEQDGNNFLRFELYSDGASTYLYGAAIIAGAQTTQVNTPIAAGAASFWLRIKRTGNSWTESWSTDGNTYITGVTFTQSLTAGRIGPFVANFANTPSSSPGFTASIDYFFNAANPLAP